MLWNATKSRNEYQLYKKITLLKKKNNENLNALAYHS